MLKLSRMARCLATIDDLSVMESYPGYPIVLSVEAGTSPSSLNFLRWEVWE
ncbi:MAG: hypothetical protein M1136_09510 [Chloroflexi bacterium]|nr:hypothetical protein [Chloroflexota bacterium]MCL5075864.1 hypothetical protein [Chloroflexota bacterium]